MLLVEIVLLIYINSWTLHFIFIIPFGYWIIIWCKLWIIFYTVNLQKWWIILHFTTTCYYKLVLVKDNPSASVHTSLSACHIYKIIRSNDYLGDLYPQNIMILWIFCWSPIFNYIWSLLPESYWTMITLKN